MPWIFVHVMKTAGTSFRSYMKKAATGKIFPDDDDMGSTAGQYIGPNRFLEYVENGRIDTDRVEYVFGHFPLWVAGAVSKDWNIATVIRDPVLRSISMIRHHRERRQLGHLDYKDILDDIDFREKMIENYQTKVFGAERGDLKSANDAMVCDASTLRRAETRLRGAQFVGVTEKLGESVDAWHHVTGLPKTSDFPHLNRAKPEMVSDDLRDLILPHVQLDMELYNNVVGRGVLPGAE